MKLKNIGRAALALAASAVSMLGMTSCTFSYTVGYLFVTGSQYNQIATYRIQNDTGQLHLTTTSGSGGVNPMEIAVNSTGTYLYVLNAGCGNPGQGVCPSSAGAGSVASQIDLFAIGGSGTLTHQATFSSQGTSLRSIQLAGNFLYAMDTLAPGSTLTGANGTPTIGGITAFTVDPNTGRLSTLLNNQQKDSNRQPLTYFPIGTNPTWLAVSGAYAFIAEQGSASNVSTDPKQAIFIYNQNASNGQLTLTQSTPTPTGATQLTYVYATGATLYALDAGMTGSTGQILPYTIGPNGVLSGVPNGARPNDAQNTAPVFPSRIIKETSHAFLYVANSGISEVQNQPASVITAYFITANGQLSDISSGTNVITSGTGPSCIVEDPSNQYIYTANFNDTSITGKKIDQTAGFLTTLPKPMPTPPGSPTWCAVTGSHF